MIAAIILCIACMIALVTLLIKSKAKKNVAPVLDIKRNTLSDREKDETRIAVEILRAKSTADYQRAYRLIEKFSINYPDEQSAEKATEMAEYWQQRKIDAIIEQGELRQSKW